MAAGCDRRIWICAQAEMIAAVWDCDFAVTGSGLLTADGRGFIFPVGVDVLIDPPEPTRPIWCGTMRASSPTIAVFVGKTLLSHPCRAGACSRRNTSTNDIPQGPMPSPTRCNRIPGIQDSKVRMGNIVEFCSIYIKVTLLYMEFFYD